MTEIPQILIRFSVLWVVLLLFSGCAGDDGRPERFPVSGTLKSKAGKPLSGVAVMLRSVEGGVTARGQVEEDGTFQLTTFEKYDGAVAGAHRVQVVSFRNADGSPGVPIQRKYMKYRTSGLEFEVNPEGENHLDIVVEMQR